ncbi:MAG: hypothetical protein ACOC1F_01935 [Myxococcota bacterium]
MTCLEAGGVAVEQCEDCAALVPCCAAGGTSCSALHEKQCEALGGSVVGDCTQCAPPEPGPCCLPDGTCELMEPNLCQSQMAGIAVDDCGECVDSVCCIDGMECRTDLSLDACASQPNHVPLWDCGDCVPEGAPCCLPDGTCAPREGTACMQQGGQPVMTCDACGNMGSCCYAQGTCAPRDVTSCILGNGWVVDDCNACPG